MRNTQTNHSECRINVLFLANIRNLIKKKRSQRDVKKTTNQWYLSAVPPISPIMYLGFLWYYIYTERRKRTSIILLKDSSDKMLVCLFVWINLHSSNGHKVLTSISLELRLGSTQKIDGRSNRNSWHVQQNYQVYNDTNVNLGTIEPVDRSIIKYTTMILVEENKRI